MKYKKQKKNWRSAIWGSNIFTLALLVLLVISAVKVSQEVMLRYKINQEINVMEQKLADLDSKTAKMDKLISYLQTDEYIEKEARLKLNLSKAGEKQINLSPDERAEQIKEEDNRSNSLKWFDYFFRK